MASLTLEKAKRYLREYTDDVEVAEDIQDLINFSKEYIKNSTGKDEMDNETYRLAQKIIICDRWENRSSADLTIKAQNALTNLLLQITYCYEGDLNV